MNIKHTRIKVKTNDGFTLLEVAISISLIAIVMLGVYRMHAQTILMSNYIRFDTTAPLLAQQKIAEIENELAETLENPSGDFGAEYPGYLWKLQVEDVESELLETTAERLKKIILTILYENDNTQFEIITYRFIEPEK